MKDRQILVVTANSLQCFVKGREAVFAFTLAVEILGSIVVRRVLIVWRIGEIRIVGGGLSGGIVVHLSVDTFQQL